MTIFGTLKSIPELASLPASNRRINWRRAYRCTWRHWQTWAGVLACVMCTGLGLALGAFAGHRIVGGMIGAGVGGFVFGQTTVRIARSLTKSILLGRGG